MSCYTTYYVHGTVFFRNLKIASVYGKTRYASNIFCVNKNVSVTAWSNLSLPVAAGVNFRFPCVVVHKCIALKKEMHSCFENNCSFLLHTTMTLVSALFARLDLLSLLLRHDICLPTFCACCDIDRWNFGICERILKSASAYDGGGGAASRTSLYVGGGGVGGGVAAS